MAASRSAKLLKNPGGLSRPWKPGVREPSPRFFRGFILVVSIGFSLIIWVVLLNQYLKHLALELELQLEQYALMVESHHERAHRGLEVYEHLLPLPADTRSALTSLWTKSNKPGDAYGFVSAGPNRIIESHGATPQHPAILQFIKESGNAFSEKGPVPFAGQSNLFVMGHRAPHDLWNLVFFQALPNNLGLFTGHELDVLVKNDCGSVVARRENPEHPASKTHLLTRSRALSSGAVPLYLEVRANPGWFSALEVALIFTLIIGNLAGLTALSFVLRTVFIQRDQSFAMLDRLTSGILMVDFPAGTFDLSPRLRGLLGLHSGAPLGENWRAFVHPQDQIPLDETFMALARGVRREDEMELRFLGAAGEAIWCRLHLSRMARRRVGGIRLWGAVVDLRESHRLQDELRAGRERFRAIYEESKEAILLMDEDGLFDGNRRATELFGFENPGALRTLKLTDLAPPLQEDQTPTKDLVESMMRRAYQEGSKEFPFLAVHRDGRLIHTEIGLAAFPYDGRRVIQALIRDVSTRHALEETSRRLRQALDASALISVVNLDGDLLEVNDAFCTTHGYTRKELLGKNYRVLASGDHSPAIWVALRRHLEEGHTWHGEIINRTKDGRQIHLQTTIQPMPQPDGSLLFLTVRFDVTARVEKEAHLRRDLDRRKEDLLRAWRMQTRLNTALIAPVHGLTAAALIQPSESVGGDFLRIEAEKDGAMVIILADCTGHGIQAAMEATLLATLVNVELAVVSQLGPGAFLKALNLRIIPFMPEGHYPTLLVARICPGDRHVTWACAGAEGPLHITQGGKVTRLPRPPGLNLGFDPDAVFEEARVSLDPGDRLLFYSDAWLEFDPLVLPRSRRLVQIEALAAKLPGPCAEALRELQEEFRACLGSTKLRDDLTLAVVDLSPRGGPTPAGLPAPVPVTLVTPGDDW